MNARYGIDWEKGFENLTKEDYEKIFVETSKIIEAKHPTELLPGAFYDRGLVYYDRSDYGKAIPDFSSAIQFAFNHPADAYYCRGLAYYSIDKYDNALSDFIEAIKIAPDFENAKSMRDQTIKEQEKQ
ncbi:hypothetical protein AGMMS49944_29050 [Spirochaetia bacterium]|nr:hypothetical protein AGMMS49944_29050 [Spirochaetia bacterium]GHV82000.1 hypothetical protein AGMMS49991_05580 [Spirochaetia bacterium]